MAIEYVSGDLFVNRYQAQAFAHGCNCQGSMGAGVAVGFKARYPEMYQEYRTRCKSKPRQFNVGDVFLWRAPDRPWVFNLATQEHYRHSRATYSAIEMTVREMRRLAEIDGITSIAMPRIGAGLGGLSWPKVCEIIVQIFEDWAGTLYIYEEFIAEG